MAFIDSRDNEGVQS